MPPIATFEDLQGLRGKLGEIPRRQLSSILAAVQRHFAPRTGDEVISVLGVRLADLGLVQGLSSYVSSDEMHLLNLAAAGRPLPADSILTGASLELLTEELGFDDIRDVLRAPKSALPREVVLFLYEIEDEVIQTMFGA